MTVTTLDPKTTTAVGSHKEQQAASQFERYDTIDTPKIVVVGFVSAILTFVVVLAAQAVFFAADAAESQRKIAQAAPTELNDGWTQQQNRLAGYGWVDANKGLVNIPVTDAMRMVVEEQRSKLAAGVGGQ